MRLLCAGDLHMGRRSTRVPDGGEGRLLSATDCWGRIVDHAVSVAVDVVLLSGDLVDRANRFFEAVGPLQRGLERLRDAGIPVVAVAGNHDFDVLPSIADALGHNAFRLLGRGGRWETEVVTTVSGPVRVAGWSFPRGYVTENPLPGLALPEDGVPTVGLLHCDLNASGSPYAPVPAQVLRAHAADLWLLGHIHTPALYEDEQPPLLYPGSPQALDPGEPGPHGAWVVTLSGQELPKAEFVPFSTVRYDLVEVTVEDCADAHEVPEHVVQALRTHLEAATVDSGPLRRVSCRLRLVGRTPVHGEIPAVMKNRDDLELAADDVTLTVESVVADTRPAMDLQALAASPDACGLLSRLVMALDTGDAEQFRELVAQAQAEARRVHQSTAYTLPHASPPEGPALHALMRRQALLLLDSLIRQKEARV